MNTPLKLAAFAVGLAVSFGAALGVGAAVGPVGPAADTSADAHAMDGGHESEAAALPAGLAVPVAFRILGPDGDPVTRYDVDHDVLLHLIAVRRDLSGFQHVHPELGGDGVWRGPPAPGPRTLR